MKKWSIKSKWLIIAFALLIVATTSIKLVASSRISYVADEPDDLSNVTEDYSNATRFFKDAASPDQGRLPHLLAAPLVLAFKVNSLQWVRLEGLIFYALYLIVLFKIFNLKQSQSRAFYLVCLTVSCCFLFSFSIFSMTTSNNLFLLLTSLVIYYYLKHFDLQKKLTSVQIVTFGVLMGLSMASKIMTVVLMVTIFLYDAWHNRSNLIKRDKLDDYFQNNLMLTMIYLVCLVLINFLLTNPKIQVISCFVLSTLFVLILGYIYLTRPKKIKLQNYSVFTRWIMIGLLAFVMTTIGSPVHANLRNVIASLGWGAQWNNNINIVNASHLDSLSVIRVKLGSLLIGAIIAAIIALIISKNFKKFLQDNKFVLIIVVVYLSFFTYLNSTITWYTLPFIPFLFLPLSYFWPENIQQLKSSSVAFVAVVLVALPISEQIKYFKLFPYGHTDGAQLGANYVGWNKPGIITLEPVTMIQKYIQDNREQFHDIKFECRFLEIKKQRLQNYSVAFFNYYLVNNNLGDISCDNSNWLESKYVITSLFSGKEITEQIATKYHKIQVFDVNHTESATIWQLN